MSEFITLETTQGPVVVRRGAIDMVVPASDSETVVTVGNAQLVVKSTLEGLDLGIQVPAGLFRPLADAPDKLAAMRAAGVSSRQVSMPVPQPRPGRVAVPITTADKLPQRPPATQIAGRPAPAPRAPRPAPPAENPPDIRAQLEETARAKARQVNPQLGATPAPAPAPSKRQERRTPPREGVQTVPPKGPKASQPRAAKAPSKPRRAAKGPRR